MEPLCRAGQFLSLTENTCFPCPAGTYNSVPGRNTFCEPCSEGCYRFFDEVYGCNATHNLHCECSVGYTKRPSNPKLCLKYQQLTAVTEAPLLFTSNWSALEQGFSNSTTNTSSAGCLNWCLIPWLSAWSCLFLLAAIIIFVIAYLIWFVCRKKLHTKHEQANEDAMPDPEKGPLVKQQQEFLEEKQKLRIEENHSSLVDDAGNSLCQFNSKADQTGVHGSYREMGRPVSIRSTSYDHAGWTLLRDDELPPASLCAYRTSNGSVISLREDDSQQTPIKELAWATGHNT